MKNILAKLHEIMKEVNFIEKDKTNTFHGYDYASEQAIKEALHTSMVSKKVLFTLSAQNLRRTASGEKGSTITDIDFEYGFYDIESGEVFKGMFVGTGEDKLDKGTYKAITGALKYILTSTFLIPTGEDPEKESLKTPTKSYIKKETPGAVKFLVKSAHGNCACGGSYITKKGQYGEFLSCSNYPKCKIKAPKIQKTKSNDLDMDADYMNKIADELEAEQYGDR